MTRCCKNHVRNSKDSKSEDFVSIVASPWQHMVSQIATVMSRQQLGLPLPGISVITDTDLVVMVD